MERPHSPPLPDELLRRIEALERRLAEMEGPAPAALKVTAPAAMKVTAPATVTAPAATPAPEAPPRIVRENSPPPAPELLPPPPSVNTNDRPAATEPAPAPLDVPPDTPPSARAGMGAVEQFIGGRLIGWLGGLAILLGTAFFLKLAFDRGWVSPLVRVIAGGAGGCLLFGAAEWLYRRRKDAIAATTAGTAIALFILTNWAAFTLYQLTDFTVAFAAGCVITAAGFAWSVWRRLLPALILAQIGGYLTPVLLQQPSRSPWGITVYLIILGAAAGLAGAWRRWRAPSILAVAGATVIFAGWVLNLSWLTDKAELYDSVMLAASALAALLLLDFGGRAVLGGLAGLPEALAVTAGLGAVALLTEYLQINQEGRLAGYLYITHAIALGAIARAGGKDSRAVRGVALAFCILAVTRTLAIFLDGTQLGIAWAAWAAALAWLELRSRAWIPLLGSLFVHGLAAVVIFQFGAVHENEQFLWSERATVCVAEIASLYLTQRALRAAGGERTKTARLAFVATQALTAFLLYITIPGERVTAAWLAQALGLALFQWKSTDRDAGNCALALLFVAGIRFLQRQEYAVAIDAIPFVNLRILCFALAAAAVGMIALRARRLDGKESDGTPIAAAAAIFMIITGIATEASFAVSRVWGGDPPIFHRDPSLGAAHYAPFWNARFVYLIISAAGAAAAALYFGNRNDKTKSGVRTVARIVYLLGAWTVLWLAAVLEAMGIADRAAGANPRLLFESEGVASSVQVAISVALGAVPAAALAAGFRWGSIHRYFGLAGIFITFGKILIVDLAHLAIEWRMLTFLGVGVLMLAGAWLYARKRAPE